jgi:hypothetical protein
MCHTSAHPPPTRYYTTALKVFTGLRLAVASGRLRAAAAAKGRRSILRRHLRAWQDGAEQQQVGLYVRCRRCVWVWACLTVYAHVKVPCNGQATVAGQDENKTGSLPQSSMHGPPCSS